MKFGICGYGNLGKAIEEKLLSQNDEIVGIFTRRKGVKSLSGSPVYDYADASKFEGKIDVMLMCGGSQEDLLTQSPQMLRYFDIIDTFDTHARIKEHRLSLERVSKKYGHTAIYSCGWDPGLFSIIRVMFENVFLSKAQTFWGKGVSQGHSEALRNIDGVLDAIQFTVPNQEVLEKVQQDPTFVPKENEKHSRECYIALDKTRDFDEIKQGILNTENYFKGQDVKVFEVSPEKVKALRANMYHRGVVLGKDKKSSAKFEVQMQSNPQFTAQIVLAFARAIKKLDKGVYSVLDVPIGKIGGGENTFLL